jgi:hypothetical protein
MLTRDALKYYLAATIARVMPPSQYDEAATASVSREHDTIYLSADDSLRSREIIR